MIVVLFLACAAKPAPLPVPAQSHPFSSDCGMSPQDWCPAPPGDACGEHKDADSCRADTRCEGMVYRGESMVACFTDDRCFASNCPTTGCITRCEGLDEATCKSDAPRCAWNGSCARVHPCARPTAPVMK